MPYRSSAATVAAVLHPRERSRVEAAAGGAVAVLASDTVGDALRLVRERNVDAVLLSVHQLRREAPDAVGRLLRRFPSVPAVAVVSEPCEHTPEMLLRLGASGVVHVVDVSRPHGWSRLRDLVQQPVTRAAARIQSGVFEAVGPVPPDARIFLEALIRGAPTTPTVRQLARELDVATSTLLSRFQRARLPSPKSYLAAMRLLHAAALFEDQGLAIADVAYRLEFSSPQSFGRHVRASLGITTGEFRRRFPFPVALARMVDELVVPHAARWRVFHPLAGSTPERAGAPPAWPVRTAVAGTPR